MDLIEMSEEKDMKCHELRHTAILCAALTLTSFGSASGQQPAVDPQLMCDAAAAAYQSYAANNDDPDKDAATARVAEGVTDCKNGKHDDGLRKINEGTAMIHDHERTKMK